MMYVSLQRMYGPNQHTAHPPSCKNNQTNKNKNKNRCFLTGRPLVLCADKHQASPERPDDGLAHMRRNLILVILPFNHPGGTLLCMIRSKQRRGLK